MAKKKKRRAPKASRKKAKGKKKPAKKSAKKLRKKSAKKKSRPKRATARGRKAAPAKSAAANPAARKEYYVTTAISYPNGAPHIGHAYEAIATDTIARFKRLDGYDVFFLTGTDEHGMKIQQTGKREGLTPKQLLDRNVPRFRAMVERMNCSHDDLLRTTEERHYKAAIAIWERMKANGDIYLSKYAGWYSVRDEAFYAEDETRVNDKGERVGPNGTPVEWVEEESYFFKLSAYAD